MKDSSFIFLATLSTVINVFTIFEKSKRRWYFQTNRNIG